MQGSTSASSTPGVWACRNCRSRNLKRLERCATCDCINPQILSPAQGSARLAQSVDALVLSNAGRGPSGSTHPVSAMQSLSPHRVSPRRQIMTYETPFRGLEALFSPTQERSPPNASSQRSPASIVTQTTTTELLHAQLSQAVAAHKALMQEYAELNKHCDAQEVTVDKLRKDMKFLDDLYQRSQRDVQTAQGRLDAEREAFDRDRQRFEEEGSRLRRSIRERDEVVEAKRLELATMYERMQVDESDQRSVRRKEREEREERISSLERDLKLLREEHAAQVSAQSQQLKTLREQFESERAQYMEASQRSLREMATAHEQAQQSMHDDVTAAKGLSSMLAQAERQMLLERVEHEQRMRYEADQRRERETSNLTSEVEQLKKTLEHTAKQRDELMSEAKFQLEMMSELRTEKAACKAELAALRVVAGGDAMGGRDVCPGGVYSISRLIAPMTPPRSLAVSPPPPPPPPPPATGTQQLEEALRAEQEKTAALEEALSTLRGHVLEERQNARTQLDAAICSAANREEDATETLSSIQLQLQLTQAKVEALQTQNDRLKDDLDDEATAHEETRKRLDELEVLSHDKLSNAARRLEAVNAALNEQQQENGRLVEECDALRIGMEDMEQVLADALASRAHGHSPVSPGEGPVVAL